MTANSDTIREYFRRQYDVEDGSVEENIDFLFGEGFVYHLGEGKTANREAIAKTALAIRNTPADERIARAYDFNDEGDLVKFRIHVRMRSPETGELAEVQSDNVWRFDAAGKVAEANPRQTGEVEQAFRAAGADTSTST